MHRLTPARYYNRRETAALAMNIGIVCGILWKRKTEQASCVKPFAVGALSQGTFDKYEPLALNGYPAESVPQQVAEYIAEMCQAWNEKETE